MKLKDYFEINYKNFQVLYKENNKALNIKIPREHAFPRCSKMKIHYKAHIVPAWKKYMDSLLQRLISIFNDRLTRMFLYGNNDRCLLNRISAYLEAVSESAK